MKIGSRNIPSSGDTARAGRQNQIGAQFSISQPLLRDAEIDVNMVSIRVAQYQRKIVDAQTKLQAIRILANADRAYWLLCAARAELDLNRKQYELARRCCRRVC